MPIVLLSQIGSNKVELKGPGVDFRQRISGQSLELARPNSRPIRRPSAASRAKAGPKRVGQTEQGEGGQPKDKRACRAHDERFEPSRRKERPDNPRGEEQHAGQGQLADESRRQPAFD